MPILSYPVDRTADKFGPELCNLQRDQDRTEIRSRELELVTNRVRNLGGRRSADFDKPNGLTFSGTEINGRLEGSFPYEGSISAWTVMANGIAATEIWQVRPFIGVGAGFAFANAKKEDQTWSIQEGQSHSFKGGDASDTLLAYQVMLGDSCPVSEAAEIRLGSPSPISPLGQVSP